MRIDYNGGLLSEENVNGIILRLTRDSGKEGILEADILSIVKWIEDAAMDHTLVQLFMDDKLSITWKDGEPVFRAKSGQDE